MDTEPDTARVKSLTMDSEIQLGSEENIVEPLTENKHIDKKCNNLTFNCIYQIFDIFAGILLMFWAYGLFPKSMDILSQPNQSSLIYFISRTIMALYLAAFGITILIYTFYYPFSTKSLYFIFYGRGLFYIFIGNILTLIVAISDAETLQISPIQIYDYSLYTTYYMFAIGLLHIISSMITNKKCGTQCCFLASPFCQIKHGKQLVSQIESDNNISTQMAKHLTFNDNKHHKDQTLSQLSNADAKHEEDTSSSDDAIEGLLAIREELRSIERKSIPNTQKTDVIQKSHTINIEMWNKNDTNNKQIPTSLGRKSMNDLPKTKRKPRSKSSAADRPKPKLPKQHTLGSPKANPSRQRRFSEIPTTSKTEAESYNAESFRSRLSLFRDNAQSLQPTDKIDKIKNERSERDKDMKQDKATKRRATIAMQNYATKAAAHSQDINLVNKSLKNITRSNCLAKARDMGLLYGIYVPINDYQRWGIRTKLEKLLRSEDLKEEDRDNVNATKKSNKKEYRKMYVLNLRNNVLLTKISSDQKKDFHNLLTFVIETAPSIYILDFTRSNTKKAVLNIIFDALSNRLEDKSKFGPEEILLESNAITDDGCKAIIKYVLQKPPNLKVLRLSNSFNTIGTQTVVAFCDAMEINQCIIKFSLDINYLMYNNRMDSYIKRNNNLWRNNKKSNPENMIKRNSYDFMVKKSRHSKGRRSSVPKLHASHPSLVAIQARFALDEIEQKKAEERKNALKPKTSSRPRGKSMPPKPGNHKKRRSSVPDAALSIKDRINKWSK